MQINKLNELEIFLKCQKNQAPWCLIITLANVDRFSKFFHQEICKKILYVRIAKIST